MTDIHALLARVAELDSAATDGPWHKTQEGLSHPNGYEVNGPGGSSDYVAAECCGYQGSIEKSADADLIAEYRTAAPALARALEAVLEVHQPFTWDFGYGPLESCKGCADQGAGDHDYPCPTVAAITEALGGET